MTQRCGLYRQINIISNMEILLTTHQWMERERAKINLKKNLYHNQHFLMPVTITKAWLKNPGGRSYFLYPEVLPSCSFLISQFQVQGKDFDKFWFIFTVFFLHLLWPSNRPIIYIVFRKFQKSPAITPTLYRSTVNTKIYTLRK